MPTYEKRKSEGEKLVTESVANFEKGSIEYELFEGNMNKALILYNQAVDSVPVNIKNEEDAAVNAVSSIFANKAMVYKHLIDHFPIF